MNKILFVLFLIFPVLAFSQPGIDKSAKIDLIMKLCGAEQQIEQFRSSLVDELGLKGDGKNISPGQKMMTIIADNFKTELFIDSLKKRLDSDYQESHIDRCIDFYNSDLAHKMVGMENDTMTNRGSLKKIRSFKIHKADVERKKVIDKLYQNLKSSTNAESEIAYFSVLTRTRNFYMPADYRKTDAEMIKETESLSKKLTGKKRQLAIALLFVTYENASDDEIRQYAEFESTEAGRWLDEIVVESFSVGAAICGENTGRELGQYFNSIFSP